MKYENEDGDGCDFNWSRGKLFDQLVTTVLKENCEDAKQARILNVVKKDTVKHRPFPLNTIEA